MRSCLVGLVLVLGCSRSPLQIAESNQCSDEGPGCEKCETLDQTRCGARIDCRAVKSCDCGRTGKFTCGAAAAPPLLCQPCPPPPAPSCFSLDKTGCGQRADCQSGLCSSCTRSGERFFSCTPRGAELCGGSCPSCGTLDQINCDQAANCHSVFQVTDGGPYPCPKCDTSPCWCAQFLRCENTRYADCEFREQWDCPGAPACHGFSDDFTEEYHGKCGDGCVRKVDCLPTNH